ncbi:hypothetical protein [Streptomyces sp. NPDC003832]
MLFSQLTTAWEPLPWEEAVRRFPFLLGPDLEFDALFGEEPERVLVHSGDLTVAGGVAVGCGVDDVEAREDVEAVHVIDGDLTVEGSLYFYNEGHYSTLCVTGSVAAGNLLCRSECVLFVEGALHVGNLLVTDLYEAGLLSVEGPSSVGSWLGLETREALIALDGDTRARAVAADVLLPEFVDGDRVDLGRLAAAAVAGRPVTAAALDQG